MTDEFAGSLPRRDEEFRNELTALINRYSLENGSNTPDFLIADYLITCLTAFHNGVNGRAKWYGQRGPKGSALGEIARNAIGGNSAS